MPENVTENRWLVSYAKCDWEEAVKLLAGLECAWADYRGFHVESAAPVAVPPYSHIWAWTRDGSRLVRGRIDGDYVWLGELCTSEPKIEGKQQVETLPVVRRPIITWNAGDLVIGEQDARHLEPGYYAVEVLSPNPVTFIGAASPQGAENA